MEELGNHFFSCRGVRVAVENLIARWLQLAEAPDLNQQDLWSCLGA